MKILEARVRWMEGYVNAPTLEVLVDETPKQSDLRYEQRGRNFFAHLDGYVSFFHGSTEKNEGGYGGREFPITLLDGTEVTLKGPWSSRSSAMNALGFEPSAEVSFAVAGDKYCKPYNSQDDQAWQAFYGGHMTLPRLKEAVALIPGVRLYRWQDQDGKGTDWGFGFGTDAGPREKCWDCEKSWTFVD